MDKTLNREILRLAIPSVLANLTIPLVSLVDVAVTGRVADAAAIAGIAVAGTIFDLLYWSFGFLRVGTASMTARAYGRNDIPEAAGLLIRSSVIALIGALVILLLQIPLLDPALRLMNADREATAFARLYFRIRVIAAPATLMLLTLKGWFIGMQDTRTPMISDLTVNTVNILASWLLSTRTPLGAAGVAWGTLIAQYIGLTVTLGLLIGRQRAIFRHIGRTWRNAGRGELFSLNGNLFIRSVCFMVVYVGFTRLTTNYGTEAVAIGSVVMKLFMFFSFFVDGFGYAAEALVGRETGRRSRRGVSTTVAALCRFTAIVTLLFTIIFGLFGTQISEWLIGDGVSVTGLEVYFWLMPALSAGAFLLDGVYIGAGLGRDLALCMTISAAAFVLVYLGCRPIGTVDAVYIAYMAHLVARVLYLGLRIPKMLARVEQG